MAYTKSQRQEGECQVWHLANRAVELERDCEESSMPSLGAYTFEQGISGLSYALQSLLCQRGGECTGARRDQKLEAPLGGSHEPRL